VVIMGSDTSTVRGVWEVCVAAGLPRSSCRVAESQRRM